MQLIKHHNIPSKKVKNWKEIKSQVEELSVMVNGKFEGPYKSAFALNHCQVTKDSFAFFVVHKSMVRKGLFKNQVVINPEITNTKDCPKMGMPEACMTFPHRKSKEIERYVRIDVKYQIPTWFGFLRTIKERVIGLKAQVFQHEIEHIFGKNMYYDN